MRRNFRAGPGLSSLAVLLLIVATPVAAQPAHDHGEPSASQTRTVWQWSWDANAFGGWNYQARKFRDFQRLESQNWLMGSGERAMLGGHLRLHAMVSFEPFTIQPLGSPQVFQTGETFQGAALIDYQHPHDLFMNLSGKWQGAHGAFVSAGLVDSPAIGPPPFMHRRSAADNPTAPLGHHQLDATHITHGVITGGLERGPITVEASWFRGAEPDENRKDVDLGRLDSASARVWWKRGGWEAQVSAAHLTTPERMNPFNDATRLTASLGFAEPSRRWAALAAWGQNREVHGNLDAYLLEATMRPGGRLAWYGRAELVTKDILNAGARHDPRAAHFHPLSRIGAFTLGSVVELVQSMRGHVAIGGDVTAYRVPSNLSDSYGSPLSFHVFVRYRPNRRASESHAHH